MWVQAFGPGQKKLTPNPTAHKLMRCARPKLMFAGSSRVALDVGANLGLIVISSAIVITVIIVNGGE